MKDYNWEDVIRCVHAQEKQSDMDPHPVHGDRTRQVDSSNLAYVRLQSFLRKKLSGWSLEERNRVRDGAFDIAREFDLSSRRTLRLIISLSQLASRHSIATDWQLQPAGGQISRKLKGVQKSVRRVASFWSPSDRINGSAADLLTRAAAGWASEQRTDLLQSFGFSREVFSSGGVEIVAYNEMEVVRRWFELAPLILQFIERAQQEIDVSLSNTVASLEEEHRAQSRLVGSQLPRLYERITGKRFGVAKSREGDRARDTTGVKFVRLSLQAIGLSPISPDTVVSHWRNEKLRGRAHSPKEKQRV